MIDRLTAALADRYRIVKEIGAGGMATVYLAHDVRHDRQVALKVLRPELSAILGGERFLTEIKTTANLQHPHILPLHDSGEIDGVVFYVMPLVEGESLRDRLSREGQLPVGDAVKLTREVAGALDYAHRHGVVHRDIKPENILLHEGQALVADFGIALAVSRSDGATRMTETGLSLGTPHYMSPEQAMGERTVDARTDVYALGCVLYESLTGEPPFTGPSAQAIIARVLAGEPEPVTTLRGTVPPHVAAAVHTAIQKLPADRFPTAAAFADALSNASFTTALAMPGAVGARAGLRHNRPALALGAIAILATAAAAWGWLRPGPPAEVSRYSILLPEGQALGPSQQSRIAISPDGMVLVYVSDGGNDGRTLMVRRRDALAASSITGSGGAFNPFFSPDGQRVGFVSGSPRAIRVAALAGGPPVTLTDSLVDQGGASWGRDGYVYYDGRLEGDGLARVPETGGRPEPATMPDSTESWHFQPEALPNGKGLLFTAAFGGASGRWMVAATQTGSMKHSRLVEGRSPRYRDGYLFYVTAEGLLMAAPFDQDRLAITGPAVPMAEGLALRGLGRVDLALSETGTLLYTSGGAAAVGASELVWVSRSGEATPIDPDWVGRMSSIALSPDGGRVAFDVRDGGRRDVWVKRLDRSPASRISFGAPINSDPAWTPDGKSIAFTARGGDAESGDGPRRTMVGPADGSALPTVHPVGEAAVRTAFTADGKWIVYQAAGGDLYAMRTDGDTARVELVVQPSVDVEGTVSPDGRWLAYMSDESGQYEVYVRPFPDTRLAKRVISTNGGVAPKWSRDGRELFYFDANTDAPNLVSAPVVPGAAFAVGEQRVLFNAAAFRVGFGEYQPSPDGSRFLMLRPPAGLAERPDELIVVENFLAEVRAKVKR